MTYTGAGITIKHKVLFGTTAPTTIAAKKGDEYLVTLSGDNTTAATESWIHDGTSWEKLPGGVTEDNWRTVVGDLKPDGTNDTTESIRRNGKIGIGTDPLAWLDIQATSPSTYPEVFEYMARFKNNNPDGTTRLSVDNSTGQQLFLQAIGANFLLPNIRKALTLSAEGSPLALIITTDADKANGGTAPIYFVAGGSQIPVQVSIAPMTGNMAIGKNTTLGKEKLDVAGAVVVGNNNYNGVVKGSTTPVPAGGAGTIIFNGTRFFGWNGTSWRQLDN